MLVDLRVKLLVEQTRRMYAGESDTEEQLQRLIGTSPDSIREFMRWYLASADEIVAAVDEIDDANASAILSGEVVQIVVASELSFREKFCFFVEGCDTAHGRGLNWIDSFFGDYQEVSAFQKQFGLLPNEQRVYLLWSLLLSGGRFAYALQYFVRAIDWRDLSGVIETGRYVFDGEVEWLPDYYREVLQLAIKHKIVSMT